MSSRPLDELPYIEWSPPGGGTKRIYADSWVNEEVSASAIITEHAVETGARVSDHYLPDQLAARARLFFSGSPIRGDLDSENAGQVQSVTFPFPEYPNNTPLLTPGGLTNAAEAGIGAVANALGIGGESPPPKLKILKFSKNPDRLRRVFAQMLELRQKAILMAVGFSTCRIENLAIANVKLARTKDDGDGGGIDFEWKQISFVSTQSAAAVALPLTPRGQLKKDSVTVSASDVPDGPDKSGLKALKDKALGG